MTGATAQLRVTSDVPGWVSVPEPGTAEARATWIDDQIAAFRGSGEVEWNEGLEQYLRVLLDLAVDRWRDEDTLVFQVWPSAVPACVFVHFAVGHLPAEVPRPGPGDGLFYDSEGVGPGVQIPVVEQLPEGEAIGIRFLFTRGEQALVVDVEPTAPELLTALMPGLHSALQSLEVTLSDGTRFRAEAPHLLEAQEHESWVDSLASP